jgi:hypothetical protein
VCCRDPDDTLVELIEYMPGVLGSRIDRSSAVVGGRRIRFEPDPPYAARRPRTRRPGRAPVGSPSRNVTRPRRSSPHNPAALEHAARAGRQVGRDLGQLELDAIEVDHVQVGALADRDDAAVAEAVEIGRSFASMRIASLDRELRTARPVAHPVREHERRHARVADHAAVRAAVGEARHGEIAREHLPDRREIAVRIAAEVDVQHARLAADRRLRQIAERVEQQRDRIDARARGARRDRLVRIGLEHDAVVHRERAAQAVAHDRHARVVEAALGEQPRAPLGLAQTAHALAIGSAATS